MPDSAKPPEPDDPAKSGTRLKAAIPHDKNKATQLTVTTETHEHKAILEEVPANQVQDDTTDRRRPTPMQIVMQQPPAGGLMGKWANIANMSAVGLIMAVFVWILFSVRADERERRGQEREDRINDRSQTQAAFAALTSSITTMANRSDARDSRLDAFLEESRQARSEMKATQVEILKVLRAILAKKGEELDSSTAAPMPRAKVAAG